MTPLTYEEFCSAPMTHTLGITGDRGAQRMYRNEDLVAGLLVHEAVHVWPPRS